MKKKEVILKRTNSDYNPIFYTDKKLLLLYEFLRDTVGLERKDDYKEFLINEIKSGGSMGGNATFFESKDNNILIGYDFSNDNQNGLIIKKQNLLIILKKWFELTEKKANTITLIEENDGIITIQ